MASINTNLLSLTGQANLGRSQLLLATAMERLSSGLRVNSAKDDAAGQAIGNRLTSQITGRAMAQRNANDGVSMAQTAHGALDQINDKLQRIRELTVQGLNGSLTLRDTDTIQAEINMNLREIDRLAATVDYNGIPLLSGKAGTVNLQVGANDRETLGIDLNPPGFSVDSLGLTDFTIAGIEGEVTPRNTLLGPAHHIHLYAETNAQTTITYHGVTGTSRAFMQQPSVDGSYGWYVSAMLGDDPVFYNTGYPLATHYTATDTSVVSITSTGRIYEIVDNIPAQLATASFTDAFYDPFADGATRQLQQHDGNYVVRETQNGVVRYYEAAISFVAGGSGVQVRQLGAELAGPVYSTTSEIVDHPNGGDYHDLDSFDDIRFLRSNGATLPDGELVQSSNGGYYLQAEVNGETAYHRLGSVTTEDYTESESYWDEDLEDWSTRLVDKERLVLHAECATAFTGLDLTGQATNVNSTPSVATPQEDLRFLNPDGELFDEPARLMQRSDGQYVIEAKMAEGVYHYFDASVSVGLESNGDTHSIWAVTTNSTPTIFDIEAHRVPTVHGTSVVTIDPRNVTVNYTDSNGDTFSDVLRQGADGNYYFNLPNSLSSYGSFKIASLVDTEDNQVLIKTINGTNEVIIYHPSNLTAALNLVSVETDANGFDNGEQVADGAPHTIINITESEQEIRLKTPSNPLAALDQAISFVDSKRSHLGAMENRLGSVIESHETTNINLSAARSRIMGTDYAVEVANMTKAQILQQAGTSMLAQANQVPQSVLSLLG
ncbi:flagellin N-terminal helical domain-containing protein [Halomonas alkalisoli]|uniref:flagellin N-terminal helical domain-containing protein n=1 Tax=Halomonas alkalisoli TaxID=2907158 RepID=UPI0034E26DE3